MRVMSLLCAWLIVLTPAAAPGKSKNGFVLDDASIPVDEIVSGGPPRDGIPALIDPKMLPAAEADFMDEDDRVIGIEIDGEAKAYPIKILNWHEAVNDRIGEQYFVVTYCPLCGSGIVFASNAGEGRLVFGISGLLYNSDVLLYDRNTESLWSQLMGESVSGQLKGVELPQLDALHTSWADWRERYPDTRVLSTDTGFSRNYDRSPYLDYARTRRLMFDVDHKAPDTWHPKALVMGVKLGGVAKAYPLPALSQHGESTFEDRVGTSSVMVHWDEEARSAWITDAEGDPVPVTIAYWFAWYAFNPETRVFETQL